MENMVAHDIESKQRTEDVKVDESITFNTMLLPDYILQGLKSVGFKKPSPIQLAAIPMARCGLDLIVQAKSGTGKTLVFTITALESINVNLKRVQVIVVAPTREIAIQIADVIRSVGSAMKGLKVAVLVGGRSISYDKADLQGCNIAVGSPGRLRHLIEENLLDSQAVRLFVLDEADKLFSEDCQKDIIYIYNKCGESKQMLAVSATYPPAMLEFTQRFMRSGQHVTPSGGPTPVLLGLRQMVLVTRDHPDYNVRMAAKEKELFHILETVSFDQCCIFNQYATRAESMNIVLKKKGFASICLTSKQNMDERKEALHALKSNRCRILVTTDIAARGIDAASVNLIINMGLPWDPPSYLHRMGRAGRFGSQGVCISLISDGLELNKFQKLLGLIGGSSMSVNIIPKNRKYDLWNDDLADFDKLYGILAADEEENNEIILSLDENESSNTDTFKEIHEKAPITNGTTDGKLKIRNNFSFKELQKELDTFMKEESEVKVNTPRKNRRKPSSPKHVPTYSEMLCRPKIKALCIPEKIKVPRVEVRKRNYDTIINLDPVDNIICTDCKMGNGKKNIVFCTVEQSGTVKEVDTPKEDIICTSKNNISVPKSQVASASVNGALENQGLTQPKKEVIFRPQTLKTSSSISSSEAEQEEETIPEVSTLDESRKNKRKRDNCFYSSSSSEFESDFDSYLLNDSDETMYSVDEEESPSGVDLNADEDDFESLSVITSDDCAVYSCTDCRKKVYLPNYRGQQTDWFSVISREINEYVMYCHRFQ